jgi:hypothetical protein
MRSFYEWNGLLGVTSLNLKRGRGHNPINWETPAALLLFELGPDFGQITGFQLCHPHFEAANCLLRFVASTPSSLLVT